MPQVASTRARRSSCTRSSVIQPRETFKVSKGECYEIYGFDKAGKKVEIYFDPVTAAILETK